MSFIGLNQKADMRFKITPLPGMGLGIITSKAEILSVATRSKLSPTAYISLTLPRLRNFKSEKFVCCMALFMLIYSLTEERIRFFFMADGGSRHTAVIMSRHDFCIVRQGKQFHFNRVVHDFPGTAGQNGSTDCFHK